LRQEQIAAAIRRDLLRDYDGKGSDAIRCVSCGRGMTRRRGNPFCSECCRAWYDAGNTGHAQDWRQPNPSVGVVGWKVIAGSPGVEVGSDPYVALKPRDRRQGDIGVWIECAHCGRSHESKGHRCCSAECERRYSERQDNLRLMAEVGIEPAAKRRCQCCGAVIPKWRNGRRVRRTAQFCSDGCARRARRKAA
jgi:hypothetical protein